MNVLCLNRGGSSLKFRLVAIEDGASDRLDTLADGEVEWIGGERFAEPAQIDEAVLALALA